MCWAQTGNEKSMIIWADEKSLRREENAESISETEGEKGRMAEVIEFIPDGATLPNVPQDACCNRAH